MAGWVNIRDIHGPLSLASSVWLVIRTTVRTALTSITEVEGFITCESGGIIERLLRFTHGRAELLRKMCTLLVSMLRMEKDDFRSEICLSETELEMDLITIT